MIPLKHLHVVLIYLAVINVVTFFMYGIDKWKAKNSKWRIRELSHSVLMLQQTTLLKTLNLRLLSLLLTP